MEHFRCSKCTASKPAESFMPSQRQNGSWCKDCMHDWYRARRGPGPEPRPCVHCGKMIAKPAQFEQRFCSSNCRARHGYAERNPKDGATCLGCGADISHMRRNTKWCSMRCANQRPTAAGVRKRARVKAAYGMTIEQIAALFEAQGECCAICGSDKPKTHHDQWHIDHDHVTGRVRGLLCGSCNPALGHFHDDPSVLRAAAAYIEAHRDAPV